MRSGSNSLTPKSTATPNPWFLQAPSIVPLTVKPSVDNDDDVIMSDIKVVPQAQASAAAAAPIDEYSGIQELDVLAKKTLKASFDFKARSKNEKMVFADNDKAALIEKIICIFKNFDNLQKKHLINIRDIVGMWTILANYQFDLHNESKEITKVIQDLTKITFDVYLYEAKTDDVINLLFAFQKMGFNYLKDFGMAYQLYIKDNISRALSMVDLRSMIDILWTSAYMDFPNTDIDPTLRANITSKITLEMIDISEWPILTKMRQASIYYPWILTPEKAARIDTLKAKQPFNGSSQLHMQISDYFKLATDAKFENEAFLAGRFVDIVFPEYRFIFEINGPTHYTAQGQLDKKSLFHQKLDVMNTYCVTHISYRDWQALRDHSQKMKFITDLLSEACIPLKEQKENRFQPIGPVSAAAAADTNLMNDVDDSPTPKLSPDTSPFLGSPSPLMSPLTMPGRRFSFSSDSKTPTRNLSASPVGFFASSNHPPSRPIGGRAFTPFVLTDKGEKRKLPSTPLPPDENSSKKPRAT